MYLFAIVFGFAMGADYMLIPLMAADLFGLRSLGRAMSAILPVRHGDAVLVSESHRPVARGLGQLRIGAVGVVPDGRAGRASRLRGCRGKRRKEEHSPLADVARLAQEAEELTRSA